MQGGSLSLSIHPFLAQKKKMAADAKNIYPSKSLLTNGHTHKTRRTLYSTCGGATIQPPCDTRARVYVRFAFACVWLSSTIHSASSKKCKTIKNVLKQTYEICQNNTCGDFEWSGELPAVFTNVQCSQMEFAENGPKFIYKYYTS